MNERHTDIDHLAHVLEKAALSSLDLGKEVTVSTI